MERAGEDAPWASLTRLTAARGRWATTGRRLQDCRTRSVFDAPAPARSRHWRNAIGPEPHAGFIEVFNEAPPPDCYGALARAEWRRGDFGQLATPAGSRPGRFTPSMAAVGSCPGAGLVGAIEEQMPVKRIGRRRSRAAIFLAAVAFAVVLTSLPNGSHCSGRK